jgi:hypothetical protein
MMKHLTIKRASIGILLLGAVLIGFFPWGSDMILSEARAQSMPTVEAADLNKKPVAWPQDFTAQRTLLLVAFRQGQQSNIDGWVKGMDLKTSGAPSWYEVPMINNPGSVGRWFIDNGMRSGIPNKADRARVVTLYGKKADMMKAMDIPNETQVHGIVVDKSGKIIVRVSGDYSEAGATTLRQALAN